MTNLLKMYYSDLRKLENKKVKQFASANARLLGFSKFGIHRPGGVSLQNVGNTINREFLRRYNREYLNRLVRYDGDIFQVIEIDIIRNQIVFTMIVPGHQGQFRVRFNSLEEIRNSIQRVRRRTANYGTSKFGIHNPNGDPDDHDVYDYIHDMMNQLIVDEYQGAFIKRNPSPRTYYIINIWQNDDDSISAICTYAKFAEEVIKPFQFEFRFRNFVEFRNQVRIVPDPSEEVSPKRQKMIGGFGKKVNHFGRENPPPRLIKPRDIFEHFEDVPVEQQIRNRVYSEEVRWRNEFNAEVERKLAIIREILHRYSTGKHTPAQKRRMLDWVDKNTKIIERMQQESNRMARFGRENPPPSRINPRIMFENFQEDPVEKQIKNNVLKEDIRKRKQKNIETEKKLRIARTIFERLEKGEYNSELQRKNMIKWLNKMVK